MTLRDEIHNDPLGKGYLTHLPDSPGTVVDMLNAQTEVMVKVIKSTTAQAWAATGPYAAIVDAANNSTHPCRASCLLIRDTLVSGVDIHMERADVAQMLAAWAATGVITQEQKSDLITRSTQPASRVEVLGLPPATIADVIGAI
jgi:hypothetical protein